MSTPSASPRRSVAPPPSRQALTTRRARSEAIRRRLDRAYVVVLAPEELDERTAPALRQRLLAIEANTDVVVDLRRVSYCGSVGIQALLDAERHLADQDSTLTLSGPPMIFDQVLDGCDLGGHFTVRRPGARRARRLGGTDPTRR